LALTFNGPSTNEAASSPNPLLDYRLQVLFTSPSGRVFDVPGFYDGDGSGSGVGGVWKARFSPDELGTWTYQVSFRQGAGVAVSLDPFAGSPTAFDGASANMLVKPPAAGAPGFLAHGRLQYVGEHHLRFQDGTYFLKTGTNSPENLFGYAGFDGVQDVGGLPQGVVHAFAPHVGDWLPGDPSAGAAGSPSGLKGIVGALNYLSAAGVNSLYFLPMNLGGDGCETAPFLLYEKTGYAKTHYDISRLEQWNQVLEHAMRKGIQAQLVLSETEADNEKWLDEGTLGTERKLFFRELVARFGHNLALKWNLGEESDYSVPLLQSMADYLSAVDPYDHPIAVHTRVDDFSDYYALLGDARFQMTSIQYSNQLAGGDVETWRELSEQSGQPWVVDMDENGTAADGVSDQNADEFRREVLYDTLFSGGCVEWYLGSQALPLGGDQSLEDFRTRADIWRYSSIARGLLESEFRFWVMEPADELLWGESSAYGGGEVFADQNRDFAVYLPSASAGGTLDLSGAPGALFSMQWFDPRLGQYAGNSTLVPGGAPRSLGAAPKDPALDWVVVVKRVSLFADVGQVSVASPKVQKLALDAGPDHAGQPYLILSSASGTSPGMVLFKTFVPLNPDGVMAMVAAHPTDPKLFKGFMGLLDAQGRATAELNLAPVLTPSLIGTTLDHAFLAGPALPTFASNPVELKIVP
jgi:hypothetical protein